MKIVHCIGTVCPASGGPARSVPGLSCGLIRNDVDVTLVSCRPNDDKPPMIAPLQFVVPNGYDWLKTYIRATILRLAPNIIHDHGIWQWNNHLVIQSAIQSKIPTVISPRGMLEPWSLNAKKWKKRFAMWIYQRRDLMAATALHATVASEAEQFRKLGFKQPIIVSPNGVDFPVAMPARVQRDDGKKTALFLSRIHPKKGLMELVEAWASFRSSEVLKCTREEVARVGNCAAKTNEIAHARTYEFLNWHFEYAGPDCDGYLAEVQQRIRDLNVESDFTYLGNLGDAEKWRAYRRADLFVLPTYSENFGIAVAEALAAGLPVLTTTGAPWRVLHDKRCGWWIEPGADALTAALPMVLRTGRDQLQEMGERGQSYATMTFSWDQIACEMKRAYEWMLGRASKPDCVLID